MTTPAADDGAVRPSEEIADAVFEALDAQHDKAYHIHAAECCWPFAGVSAALRVSARRPADEDGLRIEPDPYCPEHGNQPTAYTDCSCEGRAVLNLRRRAEAAEAERDGLRADIEALLPPPTSARVWVHGDEIRAVLARHPANQTGADDA